MRPWPECRGQGVRAIGLCERGTLYERVGVGEHLKGWMGRDCLARCAMAKRREIVDHSSGKTKRHQKKALEQKVEDAALHERVQRLKQLEIINLFGKIDFYPKYDYKVERRRKRTGN